jgi:hypothetical protein
MPLPPGSADATALFADEYQKMVSELGADPQRSHFADLASTKSLQEWPRLRHWVLERCGRFPRGEPRSVDGGILHERPFDAP